MARDQLHKFGGSSLADADCYRRVVHLLLTQGQADDLVVVSAAGKTTNALIGLIDAALAGRDWRDQLDAIRRFQQGLVQQLLVGAEAETLSGQLQDDLALLQHWLASPATHRSAIQAMGELWSARVLAALLRQFGVAAQSRDSRRFLTVGREANPKPKWEQSQQALAQQLARQPNCRLVITGYIAAGDTGETLLLGRNGSDYSATLIASLAGVKQVTLWTDVEGIFNADPNVMSDARLLPEISLAAADHLARLGSPVLHPRALQPLMDAPRALAVRSSYSPERAYTRVRTGQIDAEAVIHSLPQVCLLRTTATPHQARQAFDELQQQGLTLLVQYPERGAVAVMPEQAALAQSLLQDSLKGKILRDDSQGLVALVGSSAPRLHGAFSRLLDRRAWPLKAGSLALTTLVPGEQVPDLVARAHRRCAGPRKRIGIVVAGKGNIGAAWLAQFADYQSRISAELEAELTLLSVLGRDQALVDHNGIDPARWPERFAVEAQDYDLAEHIDDLAELPYDELILLDITASERLGRAYPQLLARGIHLISANKQAGSGPLSQYQALKQTLAERHLYWRYNATVGAGLPVFYAIDDMSRGGDRLTSIDGVFSGTLSWLFHHYDGSKPFSELVLAAREEGLTEPDPRDDLSGVDMQRKLLILAREMGLTLELDQVALDSLVPEALAPLSLDDFLARASELDQPMADAVAKAAEQGKVLRYVASLTVDGESLKARVGLEVVDADHPFASLPAGDNQFLLRSDYYPQGLVVQGPGAGRSVTAAALQSDLVAICRRLLH